MRTLALEGKKKEGRKEEKRGKKRKNGGRKEEIQVECWCLVKGVVSYFTQACIDVFCRSGFQCFSLTLCETTTVHSQNNYSLPSSFLSRYKQHGSK